jgi:uncharacterized protein YwgA
MTIDIPSLISAAGGEVVGKVRLQKLVYLLEQLGLESDFSFSYYHYGPYSEDLADAVEEEVIFRRVSIETRRRSDGVPFFVFRAQSHSDSTTVFSPKIISAIKAMQSRTAMVLELAATIHWLVFVERLDNWREELVKRKGAKTEQGRCDDALRLLTELSIAPGS